MEGTLKTSSTLISFFHIFTYLLHLCSSPHHCGNSISQNSWHTINMRSMQQHIKRYNSPTETNVGKTFVSWDKYKQTTDKYWSTTSSVIQISGKNTPLRQIAGNSWPPERTTAVKATKACDSLHTCQCHIFISLMGTQRSLDLAKLPQISFVFFFFWCDHHHHLKTPVALRMSKLRKADELNTSQQWASEWGCYG